MVRTAIDRTNKYSRKIVGDVHKQRYDATKDLAVKQETRYFPKAVALENAVKLIIDGTPSIQHHFYIAFAEEFAKKKIASERSITFTKWAMRGLSWFYLLRIAREMFGGVPELKGPGVVPPTAGYWSFHSGQGGIAYDLSGNNNDFQIFNSAWVDGKIGNCLDYDGATKYLRTNHNYADDQKTYMMWINPIQPAIPDARIFFSTGWFSTGVGKTGVYINYEPDNSIKMNVVDNILFFVDTDEAFDEHTWHHVAVTINGTTAKLYVNGVWRKDLVITVLGPGSGTNTDIGRTTSASRYFLGKIDEVIIYDRVLADAEINQYYNLTK